jgi:hypothetical protein
MHETPPFFSVMGLTFLERKKATKISTSVEAKTFVASAVACGTMLCFYLNILDKQAFKIL